MMEAYVLDFGQIAVSKFHIRYGTHKQSDQGIYLFFWMNLLFREHKLTCCNNVLVTCLDVPVMVWKRRVSSYRLSSKAVR